MISKQFRAYTLLLKMIIHKVSGSNLEFKKLGPESEKGGLKDPGSGLKPKKESRFFFMIVFKDIFSAWFVITRDLSKYIQMLPFNVKLVHFDWLMLVRSVAALTHFWQLRRNLHRSGLDRNYQHRRDKFYHFLKNII